MDVALYLLCYIAGIGTWAGIGYLVSRLRPLPPSSTMTPEELAETIRKALQ